MGALVHQRRSPLQPVSCCRSTLADESFNGSVRLRALSLRDSLLSRAGRAAPTIARQENSDSSGTSITKTVSIAWPALSSLEAPVPQTPVAEAAGDSEHDPAGVRVSGESEKDQARALVESMPPPFTEVPSGQRLVSSALGVVEQNLAFQAESSADSAASVCRGEPSSYLVAHQDSEELGSAMPATSSGLQASMGPLQGDHGTAAYLADATTTTERIQRIQKTQNPASSSETTCGNVTGVSKNIPLAAAQMPGSDLSFAVDSITDFQDLHALGSAFSEVYGGEDEDASPIPELCMDSPDSDEQDM